MQESEIKEFEKTIGKQRQTRWTKEEKQKKWYDSIRKRNEESDTYSGKKRRKMIKEH